MPQKEIELILLRQWASYLAMPIFVAGSDENLLFYNEPAGVLLGRRFDEAGEMPLQEMSTLFHTTAEDGTLLSPEALPHRNPVAFLPVRCLDHRLPAL